VGKEKAVGPPGILENFDLDSNTCAGHVDDIGANTKVKHTGAQTILLKSNPSRTFLAK